MTEIYYRIISAGLARGIVLRFDYHRTIQKYFNSEFGHEYLPIVSIFIAPRLLLLPKNQDYIYIAFDYIPSRDEREIVKISEQHYTSHFPELISLN